MTEESTERPGAAIPKIDEHLEKQRQMAARHMADRRAPFFAGYHFKWKFQPVPNSRQVSYGQGFTLRYGTDLTPGELATMMIIAADSSERNHVGRKMDHIPELWNLSCWLESVSAWKKILDREDTQFHFQDLRLPDGCPLPEHFELKEQHRAEEYYESLKDQFEEAVSNMWQAAVAQPQQGQDGQQAAGAGQGEQEQGGGSGQEQSGQEPGPGSGQASGQNPGMPQPNQQPQAGGSGGQQEIPESPLDVAGSSVPDSLNEMEKQHRQFKEALKEHLASNPGTVPGDYLVLLEEKRKTTYPWRKQVERHFRNLRTDYSDYALGPKMSPYAAVMGTLVNTTQRSLPRICLIGDISGSMTGEREAQMRAHMDKVRQVATVVFEAFGDTELRAFGRGRITQSAGHGGTKMDVLFAQVQKKFKPEAIMLFTDGETPWPDRVPDNLVVCIVNHYEVEVPKQIKRVVRVPWEPEMATRTR